MNFHTVKRRYFSAFSSKPLCKRCFYGRCIFPLNLEQRLTVFARCCQLLRITINISKRLNKIFPQKPIMAYRRSKRLRDILVHAKLTPDPSDDGPTGESKPCGNKMCFTCKLMTPTQIAKSSSGASVKLKRQTNCKSANVIYLITCTQCGKQYVGETKRPLNERMNGHRSDWTKRRFQRSPVAEHFHLQNHDFNSHVSLCCIDHDAQWSDDTRKARESYWIRRLNTMQPHGINKGD